MSAMVVPARKASIAFIEDKVDGKMLPPDIGNEVYFNDKTGLFAQFDDTTSEVDVYSDADKSSAELKAAMEAFQQAADENDKPKESKWPIRVGSKKSTDSNKLAKEVPPEPKKKQTWADVQQTMEDARTTYEDTHRGPVTGGLQRFCTSVGYHGDTFKAWLSLLPDGDYTSIVCGAFKMVISAAVRATKVRDMIFDALARIPGVLDDAKEYLSMNNLYKSIKLHYHFSRLYASILVALEGMLGWLAKSSWRHAAGAFFKGADYGKDVEDQLAIVKDRSIHVKEQAERCSHFVIGRIDEGVERQTIQLKGVTVTLSGVEKDVKGLTSSLEGLASTQDKTLQNTVQIQDKLNALLMFLQSDVQKTLYVHQNLQSSVAQAMPSVSGRKGGRPYTALDLQRLLECDLGVIKQDIIKAVSTGQAFPSGSGLQERTKYFTDSSRLKTWLTNKDSEVLLVNGNYNTEKISPLTFGCGIFATSLASFPGALPLSFFCGMHSDSKTEDVGAGLMLASLLSQLLGGYLHFDLKFLKSATFLPKDLKPDSPTRIDAMLELFSELMSQLPDDQIVFCLIDGIQYYESGARKNDTIDIVSRFVDLVLDEGDDRIKAVFKLLITTPAKSALWKTVPRDNTWTMPSVVERADQGFNTKKQLREKGSEMKDIGDAHRLRSHPEDEWSIHDSRSGEDEEEVTDTTGSDW